MTSFVITQVNKHRQGWEDEKLIVILFIHYKVEERYSDCTGHVTPCVHLSFFLSIHPGIAVRLFFRHGYSYRFLVCRYMMVTGSYISSAVISPGQYIIILPQRYIVQLLRYQPQRYKTLKDVISIYTLYWFYLIDIPKTKFVFW